MLSAESWRRSLEKPCAPGSFCCYAFCGNSVSDLFICRRRLFHSVLAIGPKSPCRYQSFEAKANQRLNSAREDFLGQTCKFPIVDVCSGVPEA